MQKYLSPRAYQAAGHEPKQRRNNRDTPRQDVTDRNSVKKQEIVREAA